MSTPANIAELSKDGKLRIVNVAMDGYPEEAGVGNVLLNAYHNPQKLGQLMKLGNVAHLGFTPKQANVYKEAGADWSQYAVKGSTISGKDYKGNYTSPQEAQRNQKKMAKWLSMTDNYTHAFQRDWSRGQYERGQNMSQVTEPGSPTALNDAVKAMNTQSRFGAEHNYLYDDRSKHWYYNKPGSSEIQNLSDVVPEHDRHVIHNAYEKFQQNPQNPKLPKINSLKAHQMINKALPSLKSQYKFDNGTLKADKQSVQEAKKELFTNKQPSFSELTQLHNVIRENSNPKTIKRLTVATKRDKAQIDNLHQIDHFLTKHPETQLYPNDLKLNSKFSKQVKSQSVGVNRNDFGHFFDSHPEYNTKLGYYSGNQVKAKLHQRNETYRKGLNNPNIHVSAETVKSMIHSNAQAAKQAQPGKIYSSAQIDSAGLFGPASGSVNFKPVGYADFKQNVHAMAPKDKNLQKLLKSQQPGHGVDTKVTDVHTLIEKTNALAESGHVQQAYHELDSDQLKGNDEKVLDKTMDDFEYNSGKHTPVMNTKVFSPNPNAKGHYVLDDGNNTPLPKSYITAFNKELGHNAKAMDLGRQNKQEQSQGQGQSHGIPKAVLAKYEKRAEQAKARTRKSHEEIKATEKSQKKRSQELHRKATQRPARKQTQNRNRHQNQNFGPTLG